MKKNLKTPALLAAATLAFGGAAAWMSANAGPPVGAGKTIRVLATPT